VAGTGLFAHDLSFPLVSDRIPEWVRRRKERPFSGLDFRYGFSPHGRYGQWLISQRRDGASVSSILLTTVLAAVIRREDFDRKRPPARWGGRMEESGAQPVHSDTHLMSVFVLFAMDGGKSSSAIFPGHDGPSNKELR
jgi:hypothetical protein